LKALEIARELNRAKGAGEPRVSGFGYTCCCPAHDDKTPSGWISDSPNGIPGVKCFAGCSKADIRKALKEKGYWPDDLKDQAKTKDGKKKGDLRFGEHYYYESITGEKRIRVTRYDTAAGGKIYVPYLPDESGSGEWIKSKSAKALPNLLYNLPKCAEAAAAGKPILDVEGEPKAKQLNEDGFNATTIFGGSNKIEAWKAAEPEKHFKNAKFIAVLPDHDKPGFKLALEKCRWYYKHGIPCKFFTFEEFGPIREDGGLDVKDYYEAFGGGIKDLGARLTAAPLWTPDPEDTGIEFDHIFIEGEKPEQPSNVVAITTKAGKIISVDPLSEMATAKRFVADHQGNVLWIPDWKTFYIWDGKSWQNDKKQNVMAMMEISIISHYKELLKSSIEYDKVRRWYVKATGLSWMKHALELAKKDISFDYERFDANPWILNCANGIIDLKTGELKPHDKNECCSRMIAHEYPGANCSEHPLWQSSLDYAFPGNTPVKGFIQRLAGYSATGLVGEKKFFLLWGESGDNMKSTISDAVRLALGPYAGIVDKRIILTLPSENKFSDPSQLLGLRLGITDEIEQNDKIDNGKFRKIISGGDTIMASRLYVDPFPFKPTTTLWGFGNEKPKLKSSGNNASWNRFVVIPFKHKVPANVLDLEYRDKLQAELPAILSWIVRGCLEWQAIGLQPPGDVSQAKKEYQEEMDILADFFEMTCIIDATKKVDFRELFRVYTQWAKENNTFAYSRKQFGVELQLRGFKVLKDGTGDREYAGLELRADYIPDTQTRFYSRGSHYGN
jgi:putative DNA primase/helicase